MGNTISSWGGQKRVASLIDRAGLPLQIDNSCESDTKRELSRFTRAYDAPGWFTGVKSTVTVPATPEVVYESLAKDLHKVFTPMSECNDETTEEDSNGKQHIFRIVRIPFKVAFVTGNLKLRLNVVNNPGAKQITFESAQEGRLITKFVADFKIKPHQGDDTQSVVDLDAKVDAKSLPPPPFKNMVKDVMVSKMDSCMVDLVDFHQRQTDEDENFVDAEESLHSSATHQGELPISEGGAVSKQPSRKSCVRFEDRTAVKAREASGMLRQESQGFNFKQRRQQERSGGFMAAIRRSLGTSLPQRRSFETRRSMEKRRLMRQRRSQEHHQALERMASASALHGQRGQPEARRPPLAPSQEPAGQSPSSQTSVFEHWQMAKSPFADQ